jgi:SCY1-like protein 1
MNIEGKLVVMLAEQPSSSSISTTTSSVTSMTSLEQEESKGAESVSDYDEAWDTENWGEMDVSILTFYIFAVAK